MRRAFSCAATAVMLVLVAACSAAPETPSSAPISAPTVASTSAMATTVSPAHTPTPTSSEAALYAEAEAVFLAYQKAAFQVAAQGGADALPSTVAPYVTRDYGIALEAQYRKLKSQGRQTRNGDQAKVTRVRPATNAQDSLAAVAACIDSTAVQWRNSDTDWAQGGKGENVYYFTRDTDGRLKIFDLVNLKAGGCT